MRWILGTTTFPQLRRWFWYTGGVDKSEPAPARCGRARVGLRRAASYPPAGPNLNPAIRNVIHKFIHSLCVRIVMASVFELVIDHCAHSHAFRASDR